MISSQLKQKKKPKKKTKKKEQCEASPKISTGNIRKSGILSRIVCVCVCVAWLNCEKWSTYKLYHSPVNVHPCRIFSDETDIACRRITCCIVLKTMRMHRINNWSCVCVCVCVRVCVNAIHVVGRVRTRFTISLSRVRITNHAEN